MAHLKRYVMPGDWPVPVKSHFWVIRPSAGPHPLRHSLPLQVLIRDVLQLASTAAEARTILRAGKVLVDGKTRDSHFPVGLMDVLTIPELNKAYRMIPTKKGLRPAEIAPADAQTKLCQVLGITTVKGGIQQLRLHDGRTVLVGKRASERIGDTVQVAVPEQKLAKHLKLEVGAHVVIIAGRSSGTTGTIKEIRKRALLGEQSIAVLETADGSTETRLDYVFPVPASYAKEVNV